VIDKEGLHLFRPTGESELGLHIDHDLRRLRDHQVDPALSVQQAFKQTKTILDTGCASEGDGDWQFWLAHARYLSTPSHNAG
jgi:hypothetical protein